MVSLKCSQHASVNLLLFFLIFEADLLVSAQSNFGDNPSVNSSDFLKDTSCSYWNHKTKSGLVRFHPDYNNQTATWTFHFNLMIPKSVDNSSVIIYTITIALIDNDTSIWNFFRKSTKRYLVWEYFNQTDQDQWANVTAICDNAYNGNYSLDINSCTQHKDDDVCDYALDKIETIQLLSVKTDRFANFNVSKMTMNISMQATSNNGIRVDYVVIYNAAPSALLVKFNKFLIELSIFSYLGEKSKIKLQTKQHSIEFCYCPTCNTTNCTEKICYLSSPLESGLYILKITPLDSRCNLRSLSDDALYYDNNKPLDYATTSISYTDCQRYIEKYINFISFPEASTTVDTRTSLDVAYPTSIAVITLSFISLVIIINVYKRHRKKKKREQQFTNCSKMPDGQFRLYF